MLNNVAVGVTNWALPTLLGEESFNWAWDGTYQSHLNTSDKSSLTEAVAASEMKRKQAN